MAPDRRNAIAAQSVVTGVDFVYVAPDQRHLDVYFLNDPLALASSLASLAAAQLRIHEPLLGEVPITALAWGIADGRNVLQLTTAAPGGFRPYRLSIDDARIDPFFNDALFDFKASCASELDCEPPAHECPVEAPVDFPVDTMARDWRSFRQALLDFASHRYPDWKDRLEADVGVMLVEVMAHLGDEMSYTQDRIAREASLEGASQRRSLRRHARLVDYEIHDGLGATGWLDMQMAGAGVQVIAAGADVWAESSSGVIIDGVFTPTRVRFEIGRGLADTLAGGPYRVNAALNAMPPHVWDESATCLPLGATEIWVDGHRAADLLLDDTSRDPPGRWVVIQTDPSDPALPARRHLVRVVAAIDEADPLAALLGTDPDVTHLVWEEAQALPFEIDLEARCTVRGNIVPITAGQTQVARFSIGPSGVDGVPRAVERTGPNGSFAYMYTLPDPNGEGLVHAGSADPRGADPEVHVAEATFVGGPNPWVAGQSWDWKRSLVGTDSAHPEDQVFTLDDGTWTRVVGFQRLGGEVVHADYREGTGVTIRFGDGEFGQPPARGSTADPTIFQATYRIGNGRRFNLPAGSVSQWDRTDPQLANVLSVATPLPTSGGVNPETAADVKKLAPDAFRARTYRAVRPEDYAEAAERLPWVQRAGCAFRWTGSWLSAFATPDPHDAATLAPGHRAELAAHLDRFRQAGREVFVLGPRYADLDLVVHLCVAASSYPADVIAAATVALFGRRGVRPVRGFFDPDRFTFGTPLDRSELEAALQAAPGVKAVEKMLIRRRGRFDWAPFSDLIYTPAADEVIRVMNDRSNPDRGSLRLVTEGGA
jgi:hypothetical protein